jgi:hypothetical protein
MSETPSRPPTQEELHSPDYQPPEREDAEEVEKRHQAELAEEREEHNRRATPGYVREDDNETSE